MMWRMTIHILEEGDFYMSAQPCGCDPEARHQCAEHESGYYKTCGAAGSADTFVKTHPLDHQKSAQEWADALTSADRRADRRYLGKAEARKTYPVASGVLDYFSLAIMEVAHVSWAGNQQHYPADAPLHWDRSKSSDEADALMRHFLQRGTKDTDGILHTAKVAWRALALLQKELEQEGK
jgi:hypothetical protein